MPSTCKWARYSCLVGAGSGRTRSTFGRSAALAPAGLLLSTADTSQSFTTPSPDAEAMCRPAASDASDQILEVWPASVLTQRPGVASGSQSRTVLSLPPVITNLPRCEPNGSCSGYLRLRSFGAHVLVLVPVRLCPCPSVIVCACVCLYVHVPVPVCCANRTARKCSVLAKKMHCFRLRKPLPFLVVLPALLSNEPNTLHVAGVACRQCTKHTCGQHLSARITARGRAFV